MGPDSVVLEDHPCIPLIGGEVRHILAVEVNPAMIWMVESSHYAEQRSLSAARWTEQSKEFAILDVQRNLVYGYDFAEGLGYLPQGYTYQLPRLLAFFSSPFLPPFCLAYSPTKAEVRRLSMVLVVAITTIWRDIRSIPITAERDGPMASPPNSEAIFHVIGA